MCKKEQEYRFILPRTAKKVESLKVFSAEMWQNIELWDLETFLIFMAFFTVGEGSKMNGFTVL